MAYLRTELQRGFYSFRRFCKWVLIAVLMGTMIGVAGVGFHHVDEYALHLFASNSWLLFLMPLSGVVIIFLYRLCGIQHDRGTNLALLAARGGTGDCAPGHAAYWRINNPDAFNGRIGWP